MEIIWTPKSKNDLNNFLYNIHIGTENSSNKYIVDLTSSIDVLQNYPKVGKLLINTEGVEIRQLIYRRHKIVYAITNKIYILHVIHSSKNFNYLKDLNLSDY